MSDVIEVSPAEARVLIEDKPNLLILDKRDLTSYKQGHVEGAMMAHEGLIENLINKGDKHAPVLVYCYQGASSQDVANVLLGCGFSEVYSMTGGFAEWKRVNAN